MLFGHCSFSRLGSCHCTAALSRYKVSRKEPTLGSTVALQRVEMAETVAYSGV